ncbi:MAG: type II toxin-antitoxin system ParD family antitoxin [Thermomonas sp.]|uniref:type II toxin-antitoxin system ParD family antitoxin n=1 Tax=Thermomonas sp. TaxID=1971895 RepID=UPI0039E6256B
MATMNISLPDELKQFVDQQVAEGAYGSSSEYLRELIRQSQREKAAAFLRQLIAEGLASGPAEPVTKGTFQQMRKELRERMMREAG